MLTLSPSQIETFDNSSPFGCQRKWVWIKLLGFEDVQTGKQKLGEEVHLIMEARLRDEKPPDASPEAHRLANLFDVAQIQDVTGIEEWLEFELYGAKFRGRADVITLHGVWDWKTTSSISKYAKKTLSDNTQMMLYAHWFFTHNPNATVCELRHVYFQTAGAAKSDVAVSYVSRNEVASFLESKIKPLVESMQGVADHRDITRVIPDTNKCNRCHFKSKCQELETAKMQEFLRTAEKTEKPNTELKIKEVTTSVSWTVNVGQYNSVKVDFGVTAAGDVDEITEYVRERIKVEVVKALEDRKALGK
jgi:hypothetical protein